MARCAYCQADTDLHEGDIPICLTCSQAEDTASARLTEQQIRVKLFQDLIDAKAHSSEVAVRFNKVMSKLPTGFPHPDGAQRIKNVSQEMALARTELTNAHNRLNDYLARGAIPDDLKRSD
jgi:hypothetical protein